MRGGADPFLRPLAPGFTLTEVLVVVALMAVLSAVAVPPFTAAMRSYALLSTSREVGSTIRSARYQAIAKNRTMRVRFNCPTGGQFRIVEFVGDPTIDGAADRCDSVAYPFPSPDPAVPPDVDGPVLFLPQGGQFGAVQDLQFDRTGNASPLTGCPACTVVAGNGVATILVGTPYETRTITVSRRGQVQVP